jgi:hypothetical protein
VKAVIQFTKAEEARALPILLRGPAGTILPNRTYVLDEEALAELRKSGIRFTALSYGTEKGISPIIQRERKSG